MERLALDSDDRFGRWTSLGFSFRQTSIFILRGAKRFVQKYPLGRSLLKGG